MRNLSFIIFCVLVASVTTAVAQQGKFSITVPLGYTFKDRVNLDASHVDVMGAFQYGGSLEYATSLRQSIELSYQRMGTTFPFYTPTGNNPNKDNDDGSVNYILIGGNSYFGSTEAKAQPFIGGGVGVGILNAGGQSATKFAWNFKGGVKINTSSAVSFKLNAYLQSIISTFGSDVWYTGGGNAWIVPDYATIFQLGLGGAICYTFPSKK